MRSSDVADFLPPFHAEALSLVEQFSECFINESSFEVSYPVLLILNILLLLECLFVPLGVILLDIINNFTSFLHFSKVALVFPFLEVDELVVPVDFHKSIIDLGLAGDTFVIGLFLPLEEESEELLAHHGSHDEACSKLVLDQEFVLSIHVIFCVVSDGNIYIFFKSDV